MRKGRLATCLICLVSLVLTAILPPSCTVTYESGPAIPTISVKSTLNGSPWSGTVNYMLTGMLLDESTVSITGTYIGPQGSKSNVRVGNWTCIYLSYGPPGAGLDSITPSPTQRLSSSTSAITFTLNFKTPVAPAFYLPFDGNLTDAVDGTEPASGFYEGTRDAKLYTAYGIKRQAFHLNNGEWTTYAKYVVTDNNFDKWKGTVEFWVRPDWNIEEPIIGKNDSTGRNLPNGLRPYFSVWADNYMTGGSNFDTSAACFLNLEQQHSRFGTSVQYWNTGEWHHIALTWMAGKLSNIITMTTTLYIDGKPLPPDTTAWDETHSGNFINNEPGWIVIGQYCHAADAGADIDELKMYNLVLDETDIEADYLELFPVKYWASDTVFYTSKQRDQLLTLEIENAGSQQISGHLYWQIGKGYPFTLPSGGDIGLAPLWSGKFASLVLPSSRSTSVYIWVPTIQEPGEYYLYCDYILDIIPIGQAWRWMRVIRLFAIPDAEQPSKPETENLTLDRGNGILIDCTVTPSADIPYFDTPGTATKDYYRRTGTEEGDRFGYQFTVSTENLGKPHLVVVDYPALEEGYTPRTMEIDIIEPHGPVVQTGVFTGAEYPAKLENVYEKQARIIFWPQDERNLITIVNRWKDHRAAAIRIWIYPILGDEGNGWFPKTNVITPEDGGRLLGLWWEEPTLPGDFGVPMHRFWDGNPYYGTPSITDFYEALRHMIDYLHYTGQNLIVYPIYFYDSPIYPSRIEGWPLWGGKGGAHPDDWFELMLKMCQVNNISVIASFTIGDIPSLEPDKYGEGGAYWSSGSLTEERAHDIFEEVLDQYKNCSALKGLSFNVWGAAHIYPINLRLRNSPLRRYFDQMLWIGYDGSIGTIHGLIGNQYYSSVTNRTLVISEWLPYSTSNPAFNDWSIKGLHTLTNPPLDEIIEQINGMYANAGVRIARDNLVKPLFDNSKWPGIRIERVLCFSGYRHDGCTYPILKDFFTDSESYGPACYGLFQKTDNTAVAIYNGYFEGGGDGDYRFPSSTYTTGKDTDWQAFNRSDVSELRGGFWRFAALTPGYRYFMQYYMLPMANLDPIQIGIGGSTIGTVGHDVRMQDYQTLADPIEIYGLPIQNFAKAYRALPAKSFSEVRLTGRRGAPDPSTFGFAKQYDGYFYIMNKTPGNISVTLNLHSDVNNDDRFPITDLGTKVTEVHGTGWNFELRPYELKSFHFEGSGCSLNSVWLSDQPY